MTETNTRPKQVERVLLYMKEHGGITQKEAMNHLSVYRLASRISELRKAGFAINGEVVTCKNKYGETCKFKRYSLDKGGGQQ